MLDLSLVGPVVGKTVDKIAERLRADPSHVTIDDVMVKECAGAGRASWQGGLAWRAYGYSQNCIIPFLVNGEYEPYREFRNDAVSQCHTGRVHDLWSTQNSVCASDPGTPNRALRGSTLDDCRKSCRLPRLAKSGRYAVSRTKDSDEATHVCQELSHRSFRIGARSPWSGRMGRSHPRWSPAPPCSVAWRPPQPEPRKVGATLCVTGVTFVAGILVMAAVTFAVAHAGSNLMASSLPSSFPPVGGWHGALRGGARASSASSSQSSEN